MTQAEKDKLISRNCTILGLPNTRVMTYFELKVNPTRCCLTLQHAYLMHKIVLKFESFILSCKFEPLLHVRMNEIKKQTNSEKSRMVKKRKEKKRSQFLGWQKGDGVDKWLYIT